MEGFNLLREQQDNFSPHQYLMIHDPSKTETVKIKVTDFTNLFSSGGSAPIETTYDGLVILIGNSGLTVGQFYIITDFQTVHYIVDSDGTQYLSDIITGVTEGLIVTAVAADKISHEAKSVLYPQDIIHYDWNPQNWLQDLSFSDLTDSDNPVIVTGFKGVIYFRHDTLLDNYIGYDFRNCKFRRWKTNTPAWDSGTTYNVGDFVSYSGWVYKSLQNDNANNTPDNLPYYWVRLLDLSLTEYWNNNPSATNNIPSDSASYLDVKTFAEGTGTATYELCCQSNHFESFKDHQDYYDITGTLLSNNVFFLQDIGYYQVFSNQIAAESYGNTIGGSFYQNQIEGYFSQNMIGNNFYLNAIGNYFYSNIIMETFSYNVIGHNCNRNTIGNGFSNNAIGNYFNLNTVWQGFQFNTIGHYFYQNTIRANFLRNIIGNYFYSNIIGDSCINNTIGNNSSGNNIGNNFNSNAIGNTFQSNTIGNDFQFNVIGTGFNNNNIGNLAYGNVFGNAVNYNTLGNNFGRNTIGNYFGQNIIVDDFSMNTVQDNAVVGVNFSTATHVYASYNCTLFLNAGYASRLSYYDGSDTQQIVNANA
jgi:hypothetical protein